MRLKIGRLFGIDIFLHWTFAAVPILLLYNWRLQMGLDWITIAALSSLVLVAFTSVLMHEFGHALAARRVGIGTRDIMITPIGGLARLERMPRDPFLELFVTIAGPVVNLALALATLTFLLLLGHDLIPPEQSSWQSQWLPMVMWLNVALFVLNLVPAFPMDGGRILRSLLAMTLSYQLATRIAAMVGRVISIGFIIYGIAYREYSLVFIGGFVFIAATYESRQFRQPLETPQSQHPSDGSATPIAQHHESSTDDASSIECSTEEPTPRTNPPEVDPMETGRD